MRGFSEIHSQRLLYRRERKEESMYSIVVSSMTEVRKGAVVAGSGMKIEVNAPAAGGAMSRRVRR